MTRSVFSQSLRRFALALCLSYAAGALTGCGDGGYSGPSGTVSGTVTLDGNSISKPVDVAFVNTEKGFSASAQTDASGKFSLLTNGNPDIPVGKYQVTVTAGAAEEMSPEDAMKASVEGGNEDDGGKGTIPAKYASPGSSGLEFEVKEGDNNFPVELKSE